MNDSFDIKQTEDAFVAHTYGRFPIALVGGKGSLVFDETGKSYIDLGSGIAVNSFGVADDIWQKAVSDQMACIQHTSNLYYNEPCARLAKMLCERTDMAKVFFANSGAEANECAVKVARKHAARTLGSDTYTILTLEQSFHGRTLTTLAATGQDHFHELFTPLTPGFVHIPAGDIDAIKVAFSQNKIAGVLVECVQGEGGVNVVDGDFLHALSDYAHKHGALFMVDEVQT
ncbi:MAG: aminotransferase class III-fold pyridoxal phosphate-dependent enzyme, partial [Eggerthellaceae bacterium]|nr:aminotransferase class III-fold pyridoxal phosphate-dependent enzyme [Eggerthellaceae bacterium]